MGANELLTGVGTYITTSQAAVATALANLQTSLAEWNYTTFNAVNSPGINGTYAKFADSDNVIATALALFDAELAAIPAPNMPALGALPSGASSAWTEQYWTDLKTLLSDITGDITSADDVDAVLAKLTSDTARVESALFGRGLARRQSMLRDEVSAASTLVGNSGFTYPNSARDAFAIQALQRFNFGLGEESLKLVDKIFEWAKSQFQFAAEKQISAHSADTDFNVRYAGVLIQSYSEQVKAALQEFRERITGITDKASNAIKAYLARAEVVKVNAGIDADKDRLALAEFDTEVRQNISAVEKLVQEAIEQARLKINGATSVVSSATQMASVANQVAVGVFNG